MTPLGQFPSAAFTFGCDVREDYRDQPLRQPRRRASTTVPSLHHFCLQQPVIEPAFPDPWPGVWLPSVFWLNWRLLSPRPNGRCSLSLMVRQCLASQPLQFRAGLFLLR
jgi:hypothetical protein